MISQTMGEAPVLFPLDPLPEELIAMSMWTSPSAEMLLCGKIKSQVPLNDGYCEVARGEIATVSVSHKAAIIVRSERVKVMEVSARAEARPVRAAMKAVENRRNWGGMEERR